MQALFGMNGVRTWFILGLSSASGSSRQMLDVDGLIWVARRALLDGYMHMTTVWTMHPHCEMNDVVV
ncbi:hypothetical protein GCM10025779_01980 [Arthrobacter cryoconiti]